MLRKKAGLYGSVPTGIAAPFGGAGISWEPPLGMLLSPNESLLRNNKQTTTALLEEL
jgi:hypothetical protein